MTDRHQRVRQTEGRAPRPAFGVFGPVGSRAITRPARPRRHTTASTTSTRDRIDDTDDDIDEYIDEYIDDTDAIDDTEHIDGIDHVDHTHRHHHPPGSTTT